MKSKDKDLVVCINPNDKVLSKMLLIVIELLEENSYDPLGCISCPWVKEKSWQEDSGNKVLFKKGIFFLKELLIFCVVPWNKRNAPAREQSNKVKTRMAKKWDRCVLVENMTLWTKNEQGLKEYEKRNSVLNHA